MSVAISKGNMKVGKLPNVSLTPCATCPSDAPCRSKCYAMKAYRQYPNVRNAWGGNTETARNNLSLYMSEINSYIQKKRPSYFRWHVAGDIENQSYLDGMIEIANKNPDTKFLAFTKNHGLDFSKVPSNLQVVASLWTGWGKRPANMRVAWMQDGKEDRIPSDSVKCPGACENCKVCWNLNSLQKDVVFDIH